MRFHAPFDFLKAAACQRRVLDFNPERFEIAADQKIDTDDDDELLRGGIAETGAHGLDQRGIAFDMGREIIGECETGVFRVGEMRRR